MPRGDGDGWSRGSDGQRRWGRFGAAGLLLRAPGEHGPQVLLQHRAFWSHHGGTWGLPGGARDSHESPVQTALREAGEETGVRAADVVVRAQRITTALSHGWSYTTVVADAAGPLATSRNGESAELRWVPEVEVDRLPLHPGLAASWPTLRARPMRLVLDETSRGIDSAFPRTVELTHGDFAWVDAPERGIDFAALGRDEECVVVTDDPALRARLQTSMSILDSYALLG